MTANDLTVVPGSIDLGTYLSSVWGFPLPGTYDSTSDLGRLHLQAQIHLDIDKRAIERAMVLMGRRRPLRVLDVGCGDGSVSASRFDPSDCIVTAIDKNSVAISAAKTFNQANNVDYIQVDLFDFVPSASFDIVWCSQFLQHVPDVQLALGCLWRLVAPFGTLICRNSDDGFDVSYPENLELKHVVDMTGCLNGASDRQIGRKLYHYFKTMLQPPPRSVCVNFEVVSNLDKTQEENAAIFDVRHGFRIDAVKRHEELTPDDTDEFRSHSYFERVLAKSRNDFLHDDITLFFTLQFVAIAVKNYKDYA